MLLSHPSAEPEQVQTDCFCGSFNSTAGKNNGDDGSAEAVGEISRRPSSHDWIDKLVVSETGLCDHLISLSSHPDFTQRCVEANLPSNLFHCIRIVAVVEYEVAKPWGENDLIDMNPEILQLLSKLTKNITSRLVPHIHLHIQQQYNRSSFPFAFYCAYTYYYISVANNRG